jgi:outer membrane protein assembly factor BamB
LALWAGVGVFISILFTACDDGPNEPTENNEGVIYTVRWREETTNLVLVKFDAADGARLGTYPVKDYKRDELRAVGVNRRNGDVYLAFMYGFVRMGSEGRIYFDRDFRLYSLYADNDVLVDAGGKRVWVYDGGDFYLHDAVTGDRLKSITPVGTGAVSEYDNTLVAAASPRYATELIKLSKDGEELWRREFSAEKRTCVCIAVDPADGTIYVVSDNEREPVRNFYFQKLTSDGEVVFDKEITHPYGTRAEVSVLDRTIWATAGHAYHINAEGEIIKELKDKYYYMPALSRVDNKVFIAATDPNPVILAIDTETYRVIWSLRFDKTSGFVGWALAP